MHTPSLFHPTNVLQDGSLFLTKINFPEFFPLTLQKSMMVLRTLLGILLFYFIAFLPCTLSAVSLPCYSIQGTKMFYTVVEGGYANVYWRSADFNNATIGYLATRAYSSTGSFTNEPGNVTTTGSWTFGNIAFNRKTNRGSGVGIGANLDWALTVDSANYNLFLDGNNTDFNSPPSYTGPGIPFTLKLSLINSSSSPKTFQIYNVNQVSQKAWTVAGGQSIYSQNVTGYQQPGSIISVTSPPWTGVMAYDPMLVTTTSHDFTRAYTQNLTNPLTLPKKVKLSINNSTSATQTLVMSIGNVKFSWSVLRCSLNYTSPNLTDVPYYKNGVAQINFMIPSDIASQIESGSTATFAVSPQLPTAPAETLIFAQSNAVLLDSNTNPATYCVSIYPPNTPPTIKDQGGDYYTGDPKDANQNWVLITPGGQTTNIDNPTTSQVPDSNQTPSSTPNNPATPNTTTPGGQWQTSDTPNPANIAQGVYDAWQQIKPKDSDGDVIGNLIREAVDKGMQSADEKVTQSGLTGQIVPAQVAPVSSQWAWLDMSLSIVGRTFKIQPSVYADQHFPLFRTLVAIVVGFFCYLYLISDVFGQLQKLFTFFASSKSGDQLRFPTAVEGGLLSWGAVRLILLVVFGILLTGLAVFCSGLLDQFGVLQLGTKLTGAESDIAGANSHIAQLVGYFLPLGTILSALVLWATTRMAFLAKQFWFNVFYKLVFGS